MKILILGAGQVGATLADHLAQEDSDVTIVDSDASKLAELRDRLDIQTITGEASHPDVLRRAGADETDLLIAVTNSDEINMVACQVCYSLYRTPTKIARIRNAAFHGRDGFFSKDHMPIDVLINPEVEVTSRIRQLLEHPGALQVVDFADGKVQLVGLRAFYGGPLVGHPLSLLREHMPQADTRVAAIYRRGTSIAPRGDTVIEPQDEVFFIAAREHINMVMAEFRQIERQYKRILIAGGGNIGLSLARSIESEFAVKIIEFSLPRCEEIAEVLESAVVLHGDATDKDLMLEENIEHTDLFCALTNDDEVNIMSSLLAKQLGAHQVMTLIGKPAYVDLVQGGEIDIAISPQQATTSSLLTHVRRADVARVHTLRRGAAEAIEMIAHAEAKVVGCSIGSIDLPAGTTIGAIVRGEDVLIAHDHVVIEPEDHVILFLVDKSRVRPVERLFQVGVGFF
ncbi:MAG: Trk system potassium transporter TrkA [Pseudomonadota bacterium]